MRTSEVALAEQAKATMAKGSKSFSLAALLFDRERRLSARYLYSWCRYCDDAVDGAPDRATAVARLNELQRLTRSALDGERTEAPAFEALRAIAREHSIPTMYPLELLEGMRMDVEGHRFETVADLELYCYRVASVVGLMMVHVMGISHPAALRHAVDTGLAMQMTNIARDVREDFELGRLYLPNEWFEEAGLHRPVPGDELPTQECALVVKKLLRLADAYYESGRMGLRFLPLRAALAVGAAQAIYREIGAIVAERGARAWDTRAVVSLPRKLLLLFRAVTSVLGERAVSTIHGRFHGRFHGQNNGQKNGQFVGRWKPCELRETFGPDDLRGA